MHNPGLCSTHHVLLGKGKVATGSHLPCEQEVPLGWGWGQVGATIYGPLLEETTKSKRARAQLRAGFGARAAPTLEEKGKAWRLPAAMTRSHSFRGMLETW